VFIVVSSERTPSQPMCHARASKKPRKSAEAYMSHRIEDSMDGGSAIRSAIA